MLKNWFIRLLISNIIVVLLIFFVGFNNYDKISRYFHGKNILNSNQIAWGVGWENNQSQYGGSEFRFSFANSRKLSFSASSPNDEHGQGVNIYVDDKLYTLETPNIDEKELSIRVEKAKSYKVRVRHFCAGSHSPCDVSIKSVYINHSGKLLNPPSLPQKTLAILGDSITVDSGRWNFSYLMSDKLDYQLHNAGVFNSAVSHLQTPHYDWALDRYEKDIIYYKPNLVIVFLGTNDLGKDVPLKEFQKNYQKLLKGIKTGLPDSVIVTLGILRRKDFGEEKIKQYSDIIRTISESMDVSFVDTYDWLILDDLKDVVHPSLVSQKKLSNKLYESLSSLVSK